MDLVDLTTSAPPYALMRFFSLFKAPAGGSNLARPYPYKVLTLQALTLT